MGKKRKFLEFLVNTIKYLTFNYNKFYFCYLAFINCVKHSCCHVVNVWHLETTDIDVCIFCSFIPQEWSDEEVHVILLNVIKYSAVANYCHVSP